MAGPLMTRKRVVQIATEAVAAGTEGASFNSLLVYNPVAQAPRNFEKRRPASGYGGNYAAIIAEYLGTISFDFEFRGSGDDANPTPAVLRSLLLGCGMKETTTDTFKPATSMADKKTVSVKLWEDGLQKKLLGAAGNFRINGRSARKIMGSATFTGIWQTVADVGSAPTAPSATPIPPRLAGATWSLDSASPPISTFTLDQGNEVVMREDVVPVSGIKHFLVADRDPSLTIDPEAQLVATYDWFAKLLAAGEFALSLAVGAGGDGNTITIAAPKVQYVSADDADRGGKAVHNIACQLNGSSGDDEYSITFE